MNNIKFFLTMTTALILMGSCGNKGSQQQVPNEAENDTVTASINCDSTIYGLCAAESTMNTLELIADSGDTLHISLLEAKEEGKVLGGYAVGDRIAVMLNKDRTSARLVINQSALLGDWVMPNPIDGSDEIGISLKEGGIAEGIEQSDIIYKTWRIFNGRLEILAIRDGSDMEEFGIYDVIKLTPDSLVFRNAEDIYEYGRQKPFDNYGVDIELEDGEAEFHL